MLRQVWFPKRRETKTAPGSTLLLFFSGGAGALAVARRGDRLAVAVDPDHLPNTIITIIIVIIMLIFIIIIIIDVIIIIIIISIIMYIIMIIVCCCLLLLLLLVVVVLPLITFRRSSHGARTARFSKGRAEKEHRDFGALNASGYFTQVYATLYITM